jgi:tRNA A-37 threonylcarbamoyl transferase component Bud32
MPKLITEGELAALREQTYSARFSNQEYANLLKSKQLNIPAGTTWNTTPLKIKPEEASYSNIFKEEALPYYEDISYKEALRSEKNRIGLLGQATKKVPKKALNWGTFKRGARYSGILISSALVFPGSFQENMFSSLSWEGASYLASKKGIKGWKNLAVGFAGSIIGKNIYNLFSGRDDAYNTIEGLRHGGMAQNIRKTLTEFGSGWDVARAMARKIYKGIDEQAAFDNFRRSNLFKSGIKEALQSDGKLLGSGLTADVYSYTAKIKHGISGLSEDLPFVVKQTTDKRLLKEGADKEWIKKIQESTLSAEEQSLSRLGDLNVPSLYGKGEDFGLKDAILMEKFQGTTLKDNVSLEEAQSLYSTTKEAHKRGVRHTDLWRENIMRVDTPEGSKFGILDYGMANRLTGKGIHSNAWHAREDIIQDAAQTVFGRKISPQEFEESLDISRIYAHYLRGAGHISKAKQLHEYYSSFLGSPSTNQLIEGTESLFKARLEAESVLGKNTSKNILDLIGNPQIEEELLKETASTIAGDNSAGFAPTDAQMPSNRAAATSAQGIKIQSSLDRTVPGRKEQQMATLGMLDKKMRQKRIENFNTVTKASVGIGLKKAYNGSRKHNGFSTIK